MTSVQQQLKEAFTYIQKEQLEEAKEIIKPIIEADPDNENAWWLMANATSDEHEARRALVSVLKLNPHHAQARDLLDKLNEQFPPTDDELMMMLEIEDVEPDLPMGTPETFAESASEEDLDDPFASFEEDESLESGSSEIDALFADLDEDSEKLDESLDFGDEPKEEDWALPADEDPFAVLLEEEDLLEAQEEEGEGGRRKYLLLLVPILLVVCIAMAALLLLGGDDGKEEQSSEADGTELGWKPITAEKVNSEEAEALEVTLLAIETSAKLELDPTAEVMYVQTEDENFAMVLKVCSAASPDLPEKIIQGMTLIALRVGTTPSMQNNLGLVGINFTDCERDDSLYSALAPMPAVIELANNVADPDVALKTFRESWTIRN